MNAVERQQREARYRDLDRRRAALSDAERRELARLEQWRDNLLRRLPHQIANARRKLACLEGYAAEIGLGPC